MVQRQTIRSTGQTSCRWKVTIHERCRPWRNTQTLPRCSLLSKRRTVPRCRRAVTSTPVRNVQPPLQRTPMPNFMKIRQTIWPMFYVTEGRTGSLLCKQGLRRKSTMRRHKLPSRNPRSQLPTLWTACRSQDPSCTSWPLYTGERLCRNVGKYETKLRHIPQQATPQLHRGESSTPRTLSDWPSELHELSSRGRKVPSWKLGQSNNHRDCKVLCVFPQSFWATTGTVP